MSLRDLQDVAETAVRNAALGYAPADPANVANACNAVLAAYEFGRRQATREIADAFALALGHEEGFDIDTFIQVLGNMLPPENT